MRRIILIAVIASMLAGCAKWRTGTICIEPFSTTSFKTSNPIDVKLDSVDALRDQIPGVFKKQIEAETKLRIESDCSKADYVMSGMVSDVDTAMQGSLTSALFIPALLIGQSTYTERTFGIGIQGSVKNNKTSDTVSKFDSYQHYGTLNNTLWALSRKAIYGAQYDERP